MTSSTHPGSLARGLLAAGFLAVAAGCAPTIEGATPGGPGPSGGAGDQPPGGGNGGGTAGSPGGPRGTIVDVACSDQVDNVAPSIDPPGNLPASKVPLFVLLGFDDNGHADGINWVLDYLRTRMNADGTAVRATFFISGGFASEFFNTAANQQKADLIDAWKRINGDGHEVANHSWSHGETLASASQGAWQGEITKANDLFVNTLGVERCKLWGFRTPFLAFTQSTFDAVRAAGMRYDASIEFGYDWWQPQGSGVGWGAGTSESGKHYYWPFTMDRPFPAGFFNKGVAPTPGLWEIPVYTFNKIAGDMASTVTGLDFNLWTKCQSDSTFKFTEVLQQSLDQRLGGNRSPFSVGLHSDIYSQFNRSADNAWTNFSPQVRRKGLADFIDYALSKPEVRFVTFRQLITWMRQPTPL
jgi:Polysaccharide deacetylase